MRKAEHRATNSEWWQVYKSKISKYTMCIKPRRKEEHQNMTSHFRWVIRHVGLFLILICWQFKKFSIYLFIFWLRGTWDLIPNQDQTQTTGIWVWSLNHWATRDILLVSFKCSVMSTHKIFLMGKNSIDYFSKMAFYLEAEPLPDPSLALGWVVNFFATEGGGGVVLSSQFIYYVPDLVSFQVCRGVPREVVWGWGG